MAFDIHSTSSGVNTDDSTEIMQHQTAPQVVVGGQPDLIQANLAQLSHPSLKEVIHYPGMAFYTFTLANGFSVCLAHMPESVGVAAALTVQAGSKVEADTESGIAHFVEHYTCAGTKSFPTVQAILQETGDLGITFNAHTDRDLIWYEAYGPDNATNRLLALISEIVLKPSFEESLFRPVQEDILLELATLVNNTYAVFTDIEMPQALIPNSSLTRSILGSVETIASFTPQQIVDYHKYYFRPANMELFVAGRLPFNIAELIERHFGTAVAGQHSPPIVSFPPSVWDQPHASRCLFKALNDPASMGIEAVLNYPLSIDQSQAAAARVFRHILTGSPTARLTEQLCYRQPATRMVDASIQHFYNNFNVASINTQLNNANVLGPVIEAIHGTLKQLAVSGPTPQEIQRANTYGQFECQKLLHQPHQVVEFMVDQKQSAGLLHPFLLAQSLKRVTPEDVKEIACQLTPERAFVAAIGGIDQEIIDNVEKALSVPTP